MLIDIEKADNATCRLKSYYVAYDAFWRISRFWCENGRWPQKTELQKVLCHPTPAAAKMTLHTLMMVSAAFVDEKTGEVRLVQKFYATANPLVSAPIPVERTDADNHAA